MKLTVHGTGYVGLVTGACIADTGNHVLCVDIDKDKIAALECGEIPIYEPGLDSIVKRNVESGRLRFTTDVAQGVAFGELQIIAVGTPPDEDGSADRMHNDGPVPTRRAAYLGGTYGEATLGPG